jgi:hypothetical protein
MLWTVRGNHLMHISSNLLGHLSRNILLAVSSNPYAMQKKLHTGRQYQVHIAIQRQPPTYWQEVATSYRQSAENF